jgi:cell division protein FtsL
MSNLAVKYKKQQYSSQMPKQAPYPAKKAKVTLLEKLLYTAFIAFLLYAAVAFIGNKAMLYETNTEVSKLRETIEQQKKTNNDLQAEVEKLSRYERIAKKAKEMGLEINENNVKGLNP